MVRVLIASSVLLFAAACGPKSTAAGGGSTYSAPTSSSGSATSSSASELPGTYEPGLGNPEIVVMNELSDPLSLSLTDASGNSQSITVNPGENSTISLNAGTFSFDVSAAGQSLSGEHQVDQDTEYTWEFSLNDTSAGSGSSADDGGSTYGSDDDGYDDYNDYDDGSGDY